MKKPVFVSLLCKIYFDLSKKSISFKCETNFLENCKYVSNVWMFGMLRMYVRGVSNEPLMLRTSGYHFFEHIVYMQNMAVVNNEILA